MGSAYIVHVRVNLTAPSYGIKSANKQDFENYKAELQITIGNKITETINKANEAVAITFENNDEIIHSLKISSLQNRVAKLESLIRLLEDPQKNNEIKISADQYNRRNNKIIQGIPQSRFGR